MSKIIITKKEILKNADRTKWHAIINSSGLLHTGDSPNTLNTIIETNNISSNIISITKFEYIEGENK